MSSSMRRPSTSRSATSLPDTSKAITEVCTSPVAASPADVVVELNRQAQNRAVVVLDPEKHEIGVVYFNA